MVNVTGVPKEQYEEIAKEVYENMRLADKVEARHLGRDCWEYVYDSMCSSDILYQVTDEEGNVLGVTGTAPISGDTGSCVWFFWGRRVWPITSGISSRQARPFSKNTCSGKAN